jgi:hypothetical protein
MQAITSAVPTGRDLDVQRRHTARRYGGRGAAHVLSVRYRRASLSAKLLELPAPGTRPAETNSTVAARSDRPSFINLRRGRLWTGPFSLSVMLPAAEAPKLRRPAGDAGAPARSPMDRTIPDLME